MAPPSKTRADKGRLHSAPVAPVPPPSTTQGPDVVDIVPGRLNQAHWLSMLSQDEGEKVVVEIVGELMQQVMDRCYEVYIKKELMPFTVAWARETLVQILELQFLVQDEGDDPKNTLLWEEDEEPLMASTDSWAEGCVAVIRAKPPEQTAPKQIGQTTEQGSQRTSRRHIIAKLSNFTKEIPAISRDPPGFRGYRLNPIPLRKTEPDRTRPSNPSTTSLTQEQLQSPRQSLTRQQKEDGEVMVDESSSCSTHRVQFFPRCEDFAFPRLDPARLPRHRVRPQYEVLKASQLQPRKPTAALVSVPGQRRVKPNTLHGTHTENQINPLTNHWSCHRAQMNSALPITTVLLSSEKTPKNPSSESILSYSGTLRLDRMDLVPGVSLISSQGTLVGPMKGYRAHPEDSADLKPIRNILPMPQFSLEQLTAGPPPRVIPLL